MPEKHLRTRAEVWGSPMDRYVLENPVIEIDDVLVDVKAFFETRSTCERCSIPCNWGTNISEESVEKLTPILDEIREKYIPEERRDSVGWHFSDYWQVNCTNIVQIEEDRKACSFLYKKGEHYLCSIYSWAVDNRKDPFEVWPFDCIMYPIAIEPYDGILYPNKSLLTLRLPHNSHIVNVYGSPPEHEPVYDVWRREIKSRIKDKLSILRLKKPAKKTPLKLEPHFCSREGWVKPRSYKYYGKHISWYYGEEFYEKLCAHADAYLANNDSNETD